MCAAFVGYRASSRLRDRRTQEQRGIEGRKKGGIDVWGEGGIEGGKEGGKGAKERRSEGVIDGGRERGMVHAVSVHAAGC